MVGLLLIFTVLFAHAGVASAVLRSSGLLLVLLFTPLMAGWSIWVGIAISARSRDVRAAQQLAMVLVPGWERRRYRASALRTARVVAGGFVVCIGWWVLMPIRCGTND